jgi:pimeloyl-ACP methyl ester carboxylesterase
MAVNSLVDAGLWERLHQGAGLRAMPTQPLQLKVLTVEGKPIRYAVGGTAGQPGVVFIPGSPCRWQDLGSYLRDPALTPKFHLASLDRPGYGGSAPGMAHPSLADQARLLMPVLEAMGGGNPVTLVGHSFGGPVVLRLALDYPELVSRAIILAGVVAPTTQTFQWLRNVATGVWPVVPTLLKMSTVEMNALPAELERMTPLLPTLRVPTLFVQGMKDWLAPPEHATYAEQRLPAAYLRVIRLPNDGHLIPIFQKALVRKLVLGEGFDTPMLV